jgi:hypothetical protein
MAAGVGNEAGGRGSEMRGGDYMATGTGTAGWRLSVIRVGRRRISDLVNSTHCCPDQFWLAQ